MVLLNNSTWRWKPGHELSAGKLLALFGGDVQLTGSVFLENTSKEAVRTFISKLCNKRHIHDKDARGKRWPMRMVLGAGYKQRLENQEERMQSKERGLSKTYDRFFYVCQNGSYSTISQSLIPEKAVWLYVGEQFISDDCVLLNS